MELDTMQARRQALLREFRSMIPYEVYEEKIDAVYNQTNAEPQEDNEIESKSGAEAAGVSDEGAPAGDPPGGSNGG